MMFDGVAGVDRREPPAERLFERTMPYRRVIRIAGGSPKRPTPATLPQWEIQQNVEHMA